MNHQLFIKPGYIACDFALSLFNLTPAHIDPGLYQMLVIVCAIYIWMKVVTFTLSMIRRTLGLAR